MVVVILSMPGGALGMVLHHGDRGEARGHGAGRAAQDHHEQGQQRGVGDAVDGGVDRREAHAEAKEPLEVERRPGLGVVLQHQAEGGVVPPEDVERPKVLLRGVVLGDGKAAVVWWCLSQRVSGGRE